MFNTFDTEAVNALRALLQKTTLFFIASVDAQGNPHASSAPGLWQDEQVWFLLSELSPHYRYLTQQGVSSLLLGDFSDRDADPFKVERLQLDVTIGEISKDVPVGLSLLSAMKSHLGPTVGVLSGLSDFHLISARPVSGRYIRGFGKAYSIPSWPPDVC